MENFSYVKQLDGQSSKANQYGLCSVICHYGGDIERGHYVTYRKMASSKVGKQFYFTSDADVRAVSTEEVLAANPYILLYERLDE